MSTKGSQKKGEKHVFVESGEEKKPSIGIGYFGGMDVLRFICAAGVIFHHATLSITEKGIPIKAEGIHRFSGAFFLDVFFIISGFLISTILMKEYESGTFSLKNFYMRRIIRIWPLYFLIVFLRVLLFPAINGLSWTIIKTNLLYALSFTVNYQLVLADASKAYTILWSICIEEHIYLILPLLLLLFNKKFRGVALFLIITGLISWFYFRGIPAQNGYSMPYFVSTSYFYYFGIGILLACLRDGKSPSKNLENTLFNPWVQGIVFIAFFSYVFNMWGNHSSMGLTLIIHGLFGGYLVWASAQQNFVFMLKQNVSRYLGNISYAMYITHVITNSFVIHFFMKRATKYGEGVWGWVVPILSVILCMFISTLLYRYFERPILKLKKRYTTVKNKE